MKVIIPLAGKGTRLRPHTHVTPKPLLKVGGRLYYGADAIHALSLMGTGSDAFNRVSYWAFRSQRVARVLYPALRLCRNLLLKLLGRTRINNLGRPGRDRF